MSTKGDWAICAFFDSRNRIRHAGASGDSHHAGNTRQPRSGIGSEGGSGLVPHIDHADALRCGGNQNRAKYGHHRG